MAAAQNSANQVQTGYMAVPFNGPAADAVAVTPGTSAVGPFRALWVGGAGNVNLRTLAGNDVLFSGVAAGTMLPVGCDRVYSTSTTATLIVGIV